MKQYKSIENYQGGQTGLFFDFGLYESHDFVAASQMPYTLRFINLVEQIMKKKRLPTRNGIIRYY